MSDEKYEALLRENNLLKSLLQDVQEHLIDLVEDEWMCRFCGARAPITADTRKDYPHEHTCALYTK